MKEPVDHISRPLLPWRSPDAPALTECGKATSDVKVLTRSQFHARMIEYGERRMALLTCMTCLETARRWESWDVSPCQAMLREISWSGVKENSLLSHELRSIAMLIKKHPDEFEGLLKDAALWEELRVKK